MKVDVPTVDEMDIDQTTGSSSKGRRGSDDPMTNITPPSTDTSNIPLAGNGPNTPGYTNDDGSGSSRRKSGPPGLIPNFPGNMTPRDPAPFFASPSISPPAQSTSSAQSPLSSPPTVRGGLRMPPQPFALPDPAAPSSPWLQLAAASGAPTPSLEAGPGRSSPHLGYPFERLNIGGSWSGGNLWGDAQPRRASVDSNTDEGGQLGSSPIRGGSGGVNQDALSKLRLMTGKASASGSSNQTAASSGASTNAPIPSSSKPALPPALAKRRASLPKNVLGGLGVLSPPIVTGSKAPSPLATSVSSPSPTPGLKPLPANALKSLIDKTSTLVLDLRPPSAFQSSHIPSSHSIPVPSTLLRRPAFTLGKLMQMLSPQDTEAVSQWRDKSDIVLVDADTTSLNNSSILEGVAGKFEREGYSGNMWFVKGGTAAAAASHVPFVSDDDVVDSEAKKETRPPVGLRIGSLGKLAFQQESTGSNLQNKAGLPGVAQTPGANFRNDPFSALSSSTRTERPGPLPHFDSLAGSSGRQSPLSFKAGSSASSGSPTAGQKAKLQPANPFFDNIRQNLELSHGGGHERISLDLPATASERAEDLPPWLAELATMPSDQSAERLAEEFYRVEVGELKRLQAVMDWHSKYSGGVVTAAPEGQNEMDTKARDKLHSWTIGGKEGENYFPYSITAGVEQGTKNRYKNIWPYDYSRVRLETPPEEEGDYINASFVQPRGTARRYIATQGPLDATYRDFWTLVWEQHVSVIVMLTKQYEGGTMKCGNYWQDEHYGPIHVKLESQTGGEDTKPEGVTGFDFGVASQQSNDTTAKENIIRRFRLTRDDKPDERPRHLVQIQCIAWPDFDVPETPDILLNLLHDVDEASSQTCVVDDVNDRAHHPPVLVHCSAGVGRTGTFIIVDAILDALRQDRQRAFEAVSSRERSSSLAPADSGTSLLNAQLPTITSMQQGQGMTHSREASVDSVKDRRGSSGSVSPSIHGSAGSAESSKSVSFLFPPKINTLPTSTDSLPSVFTKSPSPSAMKSSPVSATAGALSTQPTSVTSSFTAPNVDKLEQEAEKMDVDGDSDTRPSGPVREESEDSKRKTLFNNLFTKYRSGSSATSLDSDRTGSADRPDRRRSGSVAGSSDRIHFSQMSDGALYDAIGLPAPITQSLERHRTPSPVGTTDGLSPVAVVLEGMRMQRMSLVQSLRQYLFVHRAIVQSYLSMVDEDRKNGRELSMPPPDPWHQDRPSLHSANSGVTSTSTDDEGHSKRRASPTELVPEATDGKGPGASLAKRASFKKMRPAPEEVESGHEGEMKGTRPRRQSKGKLAK